jgi:hypothetical protein
MEAIIKAMHEVNKKETLSSTLSYIYLEVDNNNNTFSITSTDSCLLLTVKFKMDRLVEFVKAYELLTGGIIPKDEYLHAQSCYLLVDNKKRLKMKTSFVNAISDKGLYPNYKQLLPKVYIAPTQYTVIAFDKLADICKIGKLLALNWQGFRYDHQENSKGVIVKDFRRELVDYQGDTLISAQLLVMPLRIAL